MNKIYNNLNVDNLMKAEMFNQFNEYQQEQIELGLKANVDVSLYSNPEISWFKMKQVRLGLEDNIDIINIFKK